MVGEIKKTEISEFFYKNAHLLGFTYPGKNMIIAVHELVTNSLDNCVENKIEPIIKIEIKQMEQDKKDYFKLVVSDNGTGIPEKNLETIFSKFLQGSKFGVNKESSGQQGIGASGVILFSKATTGKPTKMTTINNGKKYVVEIDMDIKSGKSLNKTISTEKADKSEHGTTLEVYLKNVTYSVGQASVDEYLKLLFLANPFATIIFKNPNGEKTEYKALTKMPEPPKELKYHPLGLSAHDLVSLFDESNSKNLSEFLSHHLQKMSPRKEKELSKIIKIDFSKTKKGQLDFQTSEKIVNGFKELKLPRPSSENLLPIGEKELESSLKQLYTPEFYSIVERPPKVYKGGIAFQVECAVGWQGACGKKNSTTGFFEPVNVRFANRVPLLFNWSADIVYNVMKEIRIQSYIKIEGNNLPLTIITNINSSNIPYSDVSKMSIADIEEIHNELHLAILEALRKISVYVNKKHREMKEKEYKDKMKTYIEIVAESMSSVSGNYKEKTWIKDKLEKVIESR